MEDRRIKKSKYAFRCFLRRIPALLAAVCMTLLTFSTPVTVRAEDKKKDEIYAESIFTEDGLEDYAAEIAYNKKQPVQTNEVEGWPKGPIIGAAGAIVMDADSGAILYGKNIDKHLYPASITKILTALLAYENLSPSDEITFSENAVFGIEMGSSNIGMDVGESITMDEALYGLMVASANEVAVALGERVAGSETGFADLMNERAKELGCQNSHFVTLNGLHKTDHYTCARDMALIAKEVYKYPDLVNYMSQMNYHFEKSKKQPDDFWVLNTNDFLTGEISCDYVVGGKTGYTDQARETLVTFAERDGVRLICVIMREEPPYEYYDTMDLLDYAFDNFKKVNISENEKRFLMKSPDFLASGDDIFGKTTTPCVIREDASLMIPENASFSDLTAEIEHFNYELPEEQSGDNSAAALTTAAAAPEDAAGSKAENTETKDSEAEETDAEDAETKDSEAKDTEAEDTEAKNTEAEKTDAEKTDAESSKIKDTDTKGTEDSPDSEAEPAENTSGSGEDPSHILEDGTRILGVIHYKYNGYEIGKTNVLFREAQKISSDSDVFVNEQIHGIRSVVFSLVHTGAHRSVYLNILLALPLVLTLSFLLCVFFFFHSLFEERKKRSIRQRKRAAAAARQSAGNNPNYPDRYRSRSYSDSRRTRFRENVRDTYSAADRARGSLRDKNNASDDSRDMRYTDNASDRGRDRLRHRDDQ